MNLLLQRNQHDREAIEVFLEQDGKYILLNVWDEACLSDEIWNKLNKEGEVNVKLTEDE